MGTNAPGKPSYEGEITVFRSPHAKDVLLVDRAEKDRYGNLVWRAVDHDDPQYRKAIDAYKAQMSPHAQEKIASCCAWTPERDGDQGFFKALEQRDAHGGWIFVSDSTPGYVAWFDTTYTPTDVLEHDLTRGHSGRLSPPMEVFRLIVDGDHLMAVPSNENVHPLLTEMFGGEWTDGVVANHSAGEIEAVKRLFLEVGIGRDIDVRFGDPDARGDLPALLIERPPKPDPKRIFQDLGGNGAHWGIDDFYPEYENALNEAVASNAPFDTGWYGVKKEIQSGRVHRAERGGPLVVEASVCSDEAHDLIDTALWRAAGENDAAGSGFDALCKAGLSEEAAYDEIDRIAEALELPDNIVRTVRRELPADADVAAIRQALTEACNEADKAVDEECQAVVAYCEMRLSALQAKKAEPELA